MFTKKGTLNSENSEEFQVSHSLYRLLIVDASLESISLVQ